MTNHDWEFLQSIPFGLIVFGKSSTNLSLPEQIGDGDLDGDLYHVLWDIDLVAKIEEYQHEISDESTDDYNFKGYASDHNKNEVLKILDHCKDEVLVLFRLDNGEEVKNWESFSKIKDQVPEILAQYALDKKYLDTRGWKWAQKHIGDTHMKFIVSHHEEVGNKESLMINFTVMFDNGETEYKTADEMIEEAPDILYNYVKDYDDLLHTWKNQYYEDATVNWFEMAQDYASELKLLHHQAELKDKLYSLYKKKLFEGDIASANIFSKAFKQSLDFRKHSKEINLPLHLIDLLPQHLHHYVLDCD